MAATVNTNLKISDGINHVYEMYYLWGFTSAWVVYWALSRVWPAEETLIKATIHEDENIIVDGTSLEEYSEKNNGFEESIVKGEKQS